MTVTAGYCTADDVTGQLPLDGKRAMEVVPRAIAAAEAWIDRYCGRSFKLSAAAVREFAPSGPGLRIVRTGDLAAVTAVRVRPDRRSDWAALPAGDFTLAPTRAPQGFHTPAVSRGVMVYADVAAFPYRPPPETTVEVTGDFGWPSVPPPVRRAAIVVTARLALQFAGPGYSGGEIEPVDNPALTGSVAEVRRMLDQGGYRLLGAA